MKKWIITVIILFVIIASITYDAFQAQQQADMLSTPTPTPKITLKSYTDTKNIFTVQIPSNWQTIERSASSTNGTKSGKPVRQQIEITQMYLAKQMGLTVQVYDGKPTCPLPYKLTTTAAGLPASYDAAYEMWIIPTTKATVVITGSYPGMGFHGPMSKVTPTAIPQAVIAADKKIVMAAVTSLTLNGLQPYKCP